jgi:holo-[acyl-carrier protein] synthase
MIGIDIIKIERMQNLINRYGNKALEKFLSQDEIQLVKTSKNAAGFWAAKEACAKALQTGIGKECGFKDMVLSKTERGAPLISLSEKILKKLNICDISLSITHDGEYAIAVVAIERGSPSTDKV